MNLPLRRWTVSQQLMLLLLVIVLPVMAIFSWLFNGAWQSTTDQAYARVQLLADGGARRLAAELAESEAVLRRLAERPRVRALDPAACDPVIPEYIALQPEFNNLAVRALDATLVCTYRPTAPAVAQVAAAPWFRQAAQAEGFWVGDAFLGSATQRWVVPLSSPVRDLQGRRAGMLILAVDLLQLQARVLDPLPPGTLIAAADRAGTIVLRSLEPAAWLGKPVPAPLLALARRGEQTVERGVDQVPRLFAYAAVPGIDWVVVAGVPEAEVLAGPRAWLVRSAVTGVIVLLAVLLLAWRIAREVIEPTHALARAAARVAGGDAKARAPVGGPADIGEVARRFNEMLDVRDRAEAEVHERERFVSALMGNLPGMVYRCLDDAAGTMVFVSEGCKAVTGYERSQLEGHRERAYADLIHPDDREPVQRNRRAALAARRPCSHEYRILARGGELRWVWDRAVGVHAGGGALIAVEGFVQDVSERRRTESALAESQDKYRAIIESALDAVVQMDGAGTIVGWNAQAQTLFGWRASQAIGRALHELIIPPQHRDAHVRGLAHYHASGEGPVLNRLIEIDALRHDGKTFPVELTVTVLRTKDGPEFTAFIRDIEGRKRAEAERRALESQLRESQKMEAIGTLAGGIAHDFNNIIGAILGNVALAREDIGRSHPAGANLEQVHRAAIRARGLVQQILAYSRRQPQLLASRPLAPLVREAGALLRATLPAGVALDLVLDDTPLHVLCDATQVQQVVMNLCTNAWHAMKDGSGRIELGVAPAAFDAEFAPRPNGLPEGPLVHLWVSDDGCGMDEATRERIFEPFFTTKALGEGTGLGLSVVHGIVTAHGGAITVDSLPGRGSTFSLYFPRQVDERDEAEASMLGELDAPRGSGQHVLYIDDDEVMLLMVEQLLARAGFRVTAQGSAWDAVAQVRQRPQDFDIVVTDFNMPEFSGLDVTRDLATLRADLPVVVSSGLVTDALREQALRAGARAVMQKENTFEELVPLVQRVLADTWRA